MPSCRRAALLVAVAASVVTAGGCGKSDEAKVRDTLGRFERDARQGDFKDVCKSVLAKDVVTRLQDVGLPCEVALQRGLGKVVQPAIDVRRVRVRGSVALAVVTTTAAGQPPSTDTVRLVKEGDGWRIASLSGAQPPAPKRSSAGD